MAHFVIGWLRNTSYYLFGSGSSGLGRSFSDGLRLFCGDELHAELLGALGQLQQNTFAVAIFVVVLALIGVVLALGEHRVDESRELVGGGGDGLRFVHT